MTAGRGRDEPPDTALDRIEKVLERWPAGLHDLGEPASSVPLDWPLSLADVYMSFDGARLFLEAIELVPQGAVETVGEGKARRLKIGTAWGDDLWVDVDGRIWRYDAGADEAVIDGTSLPRWLAGAIDAEAMLFDVDGEFADGVFDEEGELERDIEIARLRARIKRDGRAPGPRWALARVLAADQPEEARDLLEAVVADTPDQAWAWLDLARISERLGELPGAIDEAIAAAEAAPGQSAEAFFWAHAARLAGLAGAEPRRVELAARARAANPTLPSELLAGATDNLTAGDLDAAFALGTLARAIAPLDLSVLDLLKRIDAQREQN